MGGDEQIHYRVNRDRPLSDDKWRVKRVVWVNVIWKRLMVFGSGERDETGEDTHKTHINDFAFPKTTST